jgi:AcrR family transcriptional regulator
LRSPRGAALLQNRTTVRFILQDFIQQDRSPAVNLPEQAPVDRSHSPTSPGLSKGAARGQFKGQQTRAAILEAALGLASHMGLEGLSIGALAEVTKMSKSGVFAHFGSRDELQIAVIREYHARFEDEVFTPAMRRPRGLPRLRSLFERWIKRVTEELDSGCIYISGAVEFDDRPGPVRDALVEMVRTWQAALERAITLAVQEGQLHADTDPMQLLFEIHGLILALHHDARFLRNPGVLQRVHVAFERALVFYGAAAPASAGQTARSALAA